jgi:hypothetical protein
MKTYKLDSFKNGINNVESAESIPKGSLREALNADITTPGDIRRRPGYNLIYSGSDIHSLWNRFFVESGTLKYLELDNTAADIVSGLTSDPLSYCEVNGEVYFSNEKNNGKVSGPWGVATPERPPVVAVGSGVCTAGFYQVSISFIDSVTGERGGATNPVVIELQADGGIEITDIPQATENYNCEIWVSPPNGEELFFQHEVAKGTTSTSISSLVSSGKRLDTLFMDTPAPGHIIRNFKGRIYIASGSTVWYTEAQRYGLYKPSENFFNFDSRIRVLQETEGGIYVVTETTTYFLSGDNPKTMVLSIVGKSSGVEGTGITSDAKNFNVEFNGKIAYWMGDTGPMLGFPDGQLKYIREDEFITPKAQTGCTGYREINGIRQMISNLFDEEPENGFGASDRAVAKVFRNGVLI